MGDAFQSVVNGNISAREGSVGQEVEDLGDRREEYAQMYARFDPKDAKATEAQVGYIRILLKDGWLGRDDFRSSLEFFRKRTMTMERANELIRLGKKRKDEVRRIQAAK